MTASSTTTTTATTAAHGASGALRALALVIVICLAAGAGAMAGFAIQDAQQQTVAAQEAQRELSAAAAQWVAPLHIPFEAEEYLDFALRQRVAAPEYVDSGLRMHRDRAAAPATAPTDYPARGSGPTVE